MATAPTPPPAIPPPLTALAPTPARSAKRFPVIWYGLTLAAIVVCATAPIGSVLIASTIAEANGCALNASAVHPCIVGGVDRGETLLVMSALGWLAFVTLPAGDALCSSPLNARSRRD